MSETTGIKTDASSGQLLLNARQAAAVCGKCLRTWRNWDAGGHIPRAMQIGRAKYWRPDELEAWVRAGCPPRKLWSALYDGNSP